MRKINTVDLTGESGNTYTFEVYNINSNFSEVGCVYIYTKIGDNGYWQCIYIGQTKHLATRLNQHAIGEDESDICIQNSGATHLHVLLLKPESSRIIVETDIRNNPDYYWSCNMQ